jgi:hypothetical protein
MNDDNYKSFANSIKSNKSITNLKIASFFEYDKNIKETVFRSIIENTNISTLVITNIKFPDNLYLYLNQKNSILSLTMKGNF